MTELSDYRRMVSDPFEAKLRSRIGELKRAIAPFAGVADALLESDEQLIVCRTDAAGKVCGIATLKASDFITADEASRP